jgi:hypothetical protein
MRGYRPVECRHPGGRGPAKRQSGRLPASQTKGGRESVESFVVVFLAFLVWSIEAEGFVIPTGSMAPTLMGRHKEIVCPQCGYVYTVNADREIDLSGGEFSRKDRIQTGTCENCRYQTIVSDAPIESTLSRTAFHCRSSPKAAGPSSSDGTSRYSSCRKSLRSVTSSVWWGCQRKSSVSRGATYGENR